MSEIKLPKDWKWVSLGDLTQKINKVKRKEVIVDIPVQSEHLIPV